MDSTILLWVRIASSVRAFLVNQELDGRVRAIAKQEQTTRERILVDLLSTDGDRPVDAFAEVNGLEGEKYLELRYDLDHRKG